MGFFQPHRATSIILYLKANLDKRIAYCLNSDQVTNIAKVISWFRISPMIGQLIKKKSLLYNFKTPDQLKPLLSFSLFQVFFLGSIIAQSLPTLVNTIEELLDTRMVKKFKRHKIECLSFARFERQYISCAQLAIIFPFLLLKVL